MPSPETNPPVGRLLPAKAVCQDLGFGRRTLGRLFKGNPEFPQPIRCNGRLYFREDEIEEFKRRLIRRATATGPTAGRSVAEVGALQTVIAHLLGKASSDHDAEVANALRKADEIARAHGLTWHDVVAVQKPKRQPSPRAKRKRRRPDSGEAWREVCERILASGCTQWEREFCRALLDKWRGPLAEKQTACLSKIFMLRVSVDGRQRA